MRGLVIHAKARLVGLAAAIVIAAGPTEAGDAPLITLGTLLEEMVDREATARLPDPSYRCLQASSYDRRAKTSENADWFANEDWSRFERKETREGRTEWVMMDAAGPGCIVRFWMGNPHPERPNLGTLRVYLDGASEPAIEMAAEKFLNGSLVGPPLSAVRCIGRNLYLPIPYAKHCKVTYDRNFWADDRKDDHRGWYMINYRKYPEGTRVRTFSRDQLASSREVLDRTQRLLLRPAEALPVTARSLQGPAHRHLESGEKLVRAVDAKSMAIGRLAVKVEAEDMERALRSTVLVLTFDDRETVWCPVGDFFGSGLGLNPFRSWHRTVTEDGWMTCFWRMPFRKTARVELRNLGTEAVDVTLGPLSLCPWDWNERSLYFHSTWRQRVGIPTRPFSDFNFVTIRGEGIYVGDTLAIHNGTRGWWGEGDEKIFVDGEKFPSHFGTGTEDYYGYSFGDRGVFFEAPFHAEPRWEGNVGPGHVTNVRSRSLDAIPFGESLHLDLEVWHWKVTKMSYAAATFWYARPGATHNRKPEPGEARRPVSEIAVIPGVRIVPGAIEGEALRIVRKTGGVTETQEDDRWSGARQLWWRDGKPGDRLELVLPVEKAGRYRLVMANTRASDYGIFQLRLDGEKLGKPVDLYSRENIDKRVMVGTAELSAGEHRLEFEIVGTNPEAIPRHMLGLDHFLLEH